MIVTVRLDTGERRTFASSAELEARYMHLRGGVWQLRTIEPVDDPSPTEEAPQP